MAHDHDYPELVFQRSHMPGAEEHSFEDTLRDLMRNSPYLAVSVAVHLLVALIFANMDIYDAAPPEELRIEATPEDMQEIIPPEPPPEEEIEEIEEIIEEPVVSEEQVTEVDEVVDMVTADADFDSTGLNDVIGVGGGGGGNFGKVGRRRTKGQAAGTPHLEVVDLGLKWLKFHQDPGGFWSCAAFDDMCGGLGDDVICSGRGLPMHDVGITGLALLAFLGAGNTPKEGKYSEQVKNGLKYLADVQQSNGNFAVETNNMQYTYDHIIATLAMCEAYALSQQNFLKKPAEKALRYMYSIRNPGAAWRYAADHPEMLIKPNDTSVTGWAVMAMTLARDYGLPFEQAALDDAMLFFDEMTDPVNGRTGYTDMGAQPPREEGREELWPGDLTESLTAVGVLCRIFADPELSTPNDRAMAEKGVQLMTAITPEWSDSDPGKIDFYYWYYGTYALYQYQEVDKKPWDRWEKTLSKAIAETQHKEGEQAGSWDPQVDPWGHIGGRVYSTALNVLTMEVWYRYDTVIGSH